MEDTCRVGKRAPVVIYEMQRELVLKRGTLVPGLTVRLLEDADVPAYDILLPDSAATGDRPASQGRLLYRCLGCRAHARRTVVY